MLRKPLWIGFTNILSDEEVLPGAIIVERG